MRFSFGLVTLGSVGVLGLLVSLLYFGNRQQPELGNGSLRLFCAAGVREAVQDVIAEYEEAYGVTIETSYDGSGRLLSEIRTVDAGDLYLAADISYAEEARRLGLVDEVGLIAYQVPCIVSHNDSDLKIDSLHDLMADGIRLSLADPKATAVGRVTQKMLSDSRVDGVPVWELLFDNATVTRHTVNEVANDVKSRAVDAGIVWDATAQQYDELKATPIAELKGDPKSIVVAVLNATSIPSQALHFMRYLTAHDRGLKIFAGHGYNVVDGDAWAEVPELQLFTGGLMHPAIQQTIDDFEKREGVRIYQTPNGCGILVSQIKAGEHPDIYFACDTSFMTAVEDLFPDAQNLSATEMVVIVNHEKQAELNVQSLQDLAEKPMRIGLCDTERSALGDLTRRLLEDKGLWDKIQPKVLDWPSTADRLVEAVVISGLDAAIVYRANTTRQQNALDVIAIDSPDARAIQPIAVSSDSVFPNLTNRLVRQLRSVESRDRFESLGFEWLGDATP